AIAQPPRMPLESAGKPVAVIVLPEVPTKLAVACAPRVNAPSDRVTPVPEAPTVPWVLAATVVPLNVCATAPAPLPLTTSAPNWPLKVNAEVGLMMLLVGAPGALKSSVSVPPLIVVGPV